MPVVVKVVHFLQAIAQTVTPTGIRPPFAIKIIAFGTKKSGMAK